ncbi:hypothetical protein ACS0TY_002918 [Phlomoides rotata]
MVTAKESQQSSAWNLTGLNHKALLQLEQNYSLPYSTPSMHAANLALPGPTNSDLCGLNIGQPNAVLGLFKLLPPYQNISCPTGNLLGNSDMPFDCASRKRFLIFDHSENQTKLFVSPSLCPENHIIASKIPASANASNKEVASQVDQQLLVKPFVEEKWDENHLNDGESEMLEDTEEINALLYSDSDDEYDDYNDDDTDGENDEVTSMRHTPFSIEDGYNKDKRLVEEVASCDGSPKRRKLLDDGSYKKSSLVNVESPVKRGSYEDDVESCDGLDSSKIGKKGKIHEALKILGNIVPGLKSKDPLSIIEKAILYFETMKKEAEDLGGLSYPGCESSAFP